MGTTEENTERMALASSLVRELEDLNRLEKEVNDALQAAAQGKLVPKPISLASLPLPNTQLTEKATLHAKCSLDEAVFYHCMRTYYLGTAMATAIDNFSDGMKWDPHTFYLAALLHDLGISSQSFGQSTLSFEFHGGIMARHFLMQNGASPGLSDRVAEAVFRHKDQIVVEAGEDMTSCGHSPECILLIMGSHLDVYGAFNSLIHSHTIKETVNKFPRNNFNNIFPDLLIEEVNVKRFCTSAGSVSTGFLHKMRNNGVMAEFDHGLTMGVACPNDDSGGS